ncbi:MAG TPA: hypothetical protein PKK00_13855 [Bacteroidales bacterium]|nr:hypothetical protein [Bacteroidales bacterium]HPS18286.1 hypothetical protein [Bacteroidales bacterium]
MINQSFETKNLNETTGIELVIDVIKIQVIYIIIITEIGCLKILESYLPRNAILNKNISITQNNKGSVGMKTPTFKSKSLKFTESGVKKTINNNNISTEKNRNNSIKRITGIRQNQYSSLIMKILLSTINIALIAYTHFIFNLSSTGCFAQFFFFSSVFY